MLPSRFLILFILLVSFSLSQGTGRKVIMRELSESENSALLMKGRGTEEMMVMDYKEPGANKNPWAGLPPSPPKP